MGGPQLAHARGACNRAHHRPMGKPSQRPDPTPEELRIATAKIRLTWSPRERRRRAAWAYQREPRRTDAATHCRHRTFGIDRLTQQTRGATMFNDQNFDHEWAERALDDLEADRAARTRWLNWRTQHGARPQLSRQDHRRALRTIGQRLHSRRRRALEAGRMKHEDFGQKW